MISDKIRIIRVSIAEARPTQSLPNTIAAWAPAPTAPTVCAIVFSVKIAVSGLLMSLFSSRISIPELLPSCSSTDICAVVTLSRTASAMEHRKEKTRAMVT